MPRPPKAYPKQFRRMPAQDEKELGAGRALKIRTELQHTRDTTIQ
jgi:hypothetical protein